MLTVPMDMVMVPEGTKAKVYTREREDYIGKETVFTDPAGRPVMSIVVERPDGSNDAAVFAPAARVVIS